MREFRLASADTLCFSILVTGRCNASCGYCHFYARHSRSSVAFDVPEEVFDSYLDFILFVRDEYHRNIHVRFSGGEPLLLGTRLFELAKKVYDTLGVEVYVLTNGMSLNDQIIEMSIKSNISAFLVSVENPFDADRGAVDPSVALRLIKHYNGEMISVEPGVVIVRNHMFSRLPDLCDYFWDELGTIPPLSELNFTEFKSPSDSELDDLERGVYRIVNRYFSKSELSLFSYIVPELASCYQSRYLIELDLGDSFKISRRENGTRWIRLLHEYLNSAYPDSGCQEVDCPCYEQCVRVKWVWKDKMPDYCKMRRRIFDAYCSALLEDEA